MAKYRGSLLPTLLVILGAWTVSEYKNFNLLLVSDNVS